MIYLKVRVSNLTPSAGPGLGFAENFKLRIAIASDFIGQELMGGREEIEIKDLLDFEGNEEVLERDIVKLATHERRNRRSQDANAYLKARRSILGEAEGGGAEEEDAERNPLLDITPESALEIALAQAAARKREREEIAVERSRRRGLSEYMAGRHRQKRIKSRTHRKHAREEKVKQKLTELKIEELYNETEGECQPSEGRAEQAPGAQESEAMGHEIVKSILGIKEDEEKPLPIAGRVEFSNRPASSAEERKAREEVASSLFGLPGEDGDFRREKEQMQARDRPVLHEEVIPGWNAWGGEGIEPSRNPSNVRQTKKSGVDLRKRRDFQVSHVIYNERAIAENKNKKYGAPSLPYGYRTEREYASFMSVAVAKEDHSLRIFSELIGEEKDNMPVPGVLIRPIKYKSKLEE